MKPQALETRLETTVLERLALSHPSALSAMSMSLIG